MDVKIIHESFDQNVPLKTEEMHVKEEISNVVEEISNEVKLKENVSIVEEKSQSSMLIDTEITNQGEKIIEEKIVEVKIEQTSSENVLVGVEEKKQEKVFLEEKLIEQKSPLEILKENNKPFFRNMFKKIKEKEKIKKKETRNQIHKNELNFQTNKVGGKDNEFESIALNPIIVEIIEDGGNVKSVPTPQKVIENFKISSEGTVKDGVKVNDEFDTQDFVKNAECREKLGEGNFSEVFLYSYKGKFYAVKILNNIKDFNNEVKINLIVRKSTNCVKFFDCYFSNNSVKLIFEYVENGTLENFYKNKKLTFEELKNIAIQIVEGLLFLKENKIIHRDMKPENILVDENEKIKISDFGLSTTIDNFHHSPVGTEFYWSKSRCSRNYQYGADSYPLGLMLFKLRYKKDLFKDKFGIWTFEEKDLFCEKDDKEEFEFKDFICKCLSETKIKNLKDHDFLKN